MTEDQSATSLESQTFQFKGFWPAFIAQTLIIGLMIFLVIAIPFMPGGGIGGSIVFSCVAAFLSLLGWMFVVGKADIVLSPSGISRVAFGRKMQFIDWIYVERITVFPVRGAGVRPNVTGYNVISSDAGRKHGASRKIYFGDQGTDLTDLLAAMNHYVLEHQIPVYRTTDRGTAITSAL